ncbi:MAG: alpha/beta fold hydrolase [Chloroflexi bacterium]|nr:alpha/beta fold hydrolase [Chloroflexota bacterium]
MEQAYTERDYNVGGQKIHVVEAGKPGRQIALLIHGWSSSWYATSPLLGLLAQRFHCIAVDLPGYGQSPPLEERTTIPGYAELLADLIEEISDGPVVLVGHSMGGMISVTLALTHPILVERMVLLSPTISGRLSASINLLISPITMMERFGLGSLLVSSVERTVVGITDRLMRPVSFAERSGITRKDYEHIRRDARRPGQGKVRAECFVAMQENNLSGRLSKIETPTLILWGAEDNTVPLRDAGVVADEWPAADLRIVPKAGHWPHFETPDITRRQVAAYLGLPRFSDQLYTPVDEDELVEIGETAQFLAHSAVGNDLNLAQRTRLAAQLQRKVFKPGDPIVHASEEGEELYIIQYGLVEVWKDPEGIEPHLHTNRQMQHMADLYPGQITGELALFDKGTRSADLIAGPEGATLLTINREQLLALGEDDAVLGTRLMWNMSTAMSKRVRFVLWQLNRAEERRLAALKRQAKESESVFIPDVSNLVLEQAQTNVKA